MKKNNSQQIYEVGMIGLGTMGRNFLVNMAEHGFPVAGYDKDLNKVESLRLESKQLEIKGASNIQEFIDLLRKPRAIILLVPAGHPVDAVIDELLDHLQPDDLIIDAGNSYFKDTNLRTMQLNNRRIRFMGVGVSGGEEGARFGPSIMPGGSKEAYERVRPIFEATAAKVNNEPCVAYLGPESAGHFVKMVHNGIEYAIMQLISETYDLMKRGFGMTDNELHDVYDKWSKSELNSYLIEITSEIFTRIDEKTGKRLVDVILDVARQKGTGMWTSQSAMELQVPIPTIDIAVAMRNLSIYERTRDDAAKIYARTEQYFKGDSKAFVTQLRRALYAGMIAAYTQGMHVLAEASQVYQYNFSLEVVARIWRGGCIIRAALLDDIREAFHTKPDLQNLLLDHNISQKIKENFDDLRKVVCQAAEMGIPVPGLMTSLSYIDAYRSSWLPANLIQAQRDYFGAHTYERKDAKGTFHTDWMKKG